MFCVLKNINSLSFAYINLQGIFSLKLKLCGFDEINRGVLFIKMIREY